jgi:hypothetical protein
MHASGGLQGAGELKNQLKISENCQSDKKFELSQDLHSY